MGKLMMQSYKVVFLRKGYIFVEAETEEEAREKAKTLSMEDICWEAGDLLVPVYVEAGRGD